ncbi:FAD-binding oxidoreductase [Arthrobacter sp. zg-Y820]|uniref:FAD-binding oxidoreductase n=1 Tax=unclassified Arthrobacter TaxID=235627 RepID=UPI001E59446F|nr:MULTISPECIES: FAD-binding oxidoreductase [unclassified Arthrobacter]MCC9197922.1 FAD-binding oxidoreductase [Arthrobacter sp. zg-Y820]MDK1280789.1 FAD-binding oxidoreductase [Arthrobacter sp. zg.Y820]MDK1360869.1 FAD-binding oxidoreductase [Arthrobacter sp. zg-Y1219]WIB10587.1 FAD-binding oxidoreductase [Arthrobacter sp. zg-Y820]
MIQESDLEALRSVVQGTLSGPGDAGYAVATAGFNPSLVQRPDAALGASGVEDIQLAVRWAAQLGIPIGIQATGHGAVTEMDEGLMINTSRLQDLTVDPDAQTVTVGAGVRWGQVLEQAVPEGLTAPHGSSGHVGTVGYASGGGLPLMGRALGFAADHVRSIDVVTPDGRLRHVEAGGENADLFAALRGGKGNFGVITSMTLGLIPYQEFYGGAILYPEDAGPEVLETFREWTVQLPSDASASLAFLHFPDVPFLPEDRRGTSPVHLRFALFGSQEEGDTLIGPMRHAANPLLDTVGPMNYLDVGSIHMDPDEPVPSMDRATLLTSLPEDLADELLRQIGPGSDTPLALTEIRLMGGALATEPAVEDAVSGRNAAFHIFSAGINLPPAADATAAALERFGAAVEPYAAGSLVNFRGPVGRKGDVAPVWEPGVFGRLQAAKAAYDPQNLFRFSHAVPLPQT